MNRSEDPAARDMEPGVNLIDLAVPIARRWKLIVVGSLLCGTLALGITYVIEPTFTAKTTLLPPQQAQSSAAAAALASLGPLAGIAANGTLRTSADQYVSMLQSVGVSDRIVESFKLMDVYRGKFKVDARKALLDHVKMSVGKKDGLLTIEVEDTDPKRAADIANAYVEELRRMIGLFAVTEAQQRRVFFEEQMKSARDRLATAQKALQASGFNQGALKTEPRATADNYARLRAEITSGEVRLQSLRASLLDGAPEIQAQQATLNALRAELSRVERSDGSGGGPDFIGRYREFKYQETLFDLFARQFELARVDESREGALIQVIDRATPPERRTRPKRAVTAMLSTAGAAIALAALVLLRHGLRRLQPVPRP